MSSRVETDSAVKALRRRLAEAEDTLEAIRAGEVDAVVVDSPAGQQIYTLESPDQPFRIFVEQMQEGALTLNSDGTIIYCNRFFADLVGRPLEQVRGQPIDYFIASDQERFRQLFSAAAQGIVHIESWLRGPGESAIPVQLALNPLPPADLLMFGMVVTDLTERERAKQLEASRRAAEEASAARDQFLAVVSHELRTPLNSVLGWAQMLRRQDGSPPEVKRGLEVIERSAWTQAQLIDDLLDVSRVLAGKLRLEQSPVDITQAAQASINAIKPSAAAKSIRISTDYSSDQKVVVCGDADRLQQVITNLLSNAVKFTPEQGEVGVSVQEVDGYAQVRVSDNGIGIAQEFLPKLFELYQQIEGSTTRRNSGLGLGLAIVKELTELHGGQVYAQSGGEGQGATFILRLPLLTVPAVENDGEEDRVSSYTVSLAGLCVLLVEDDEAARDMLSLVLKGARARVISVANAGEALAVLEGEQVDILVSDIGLPGMDGYQLIGRVRAQGFSGRELPAIALTAFAGRDDRRRALLAGYQVHLPKPADQAELCAVIGNLAGVPAESSGK